LRGHASFDAQLKTTKATHVTSGSVDLTVTVLHASIALGRSFFDASPKEALYKFSYEKWIPIGHIFFWSLKLTLHPSQVMAPK
jgi:hypothetical protein